MSSNLAYSTKNIQMITFYFVPTTLLIAISGMILADIPLINKIIMVSLLIFLSLFNGLLYFYSKDAPTKTQKLQYISIANYQLVNVMILSLMLSYWNLSWLVMILVAISVFDDNYLTELTNVVLASVVLLYLYNLKGSYGYEFSQTTIMLQIATLLTIGLLTNLVWKKQNINRTLQTS